MRNNEFTTKKEYLQYRKEWKTEYEELSKQIRDARLMRKIYQQAYSKAELECKNPGQYNNYMKIYKMTNEILKDNIKYQELYQKYNITKNQYWHYITPWSEKARLMLEELKLAKAESNRLYWENKAVPA